MRFGVLNNNGYCINVVEAQSAEIASELLQGSEVVPANDARYGIGDHYIDGAWIKKEELSTNVWDDLAELTINQEYRITLLELGVN